MSTPNNKLNNYDNSSIASLQGADQVRKKPANTFGTTDVWGAFHTTTEILANTFDEKRAIDKILGLKAGEKGHKHSKVFVTYTGNRELTVQDFGRGVPMAFNPNPREMKYNWHMVFNMLYAGGKYNDELDAEGNEVESAYADSLGTNGLGATATQYASKYMIALSKRDGYEYKVSFHKGKPLTHYIYKGETVQFVLDMEFKEQYYVGAEITAYTLDGREVTVVLEDFDPFDRNNGYSVDFETAEKYGLKPRLTKELHPKFFTKDMDIAEMQELRSTGDGLVDNIFEKLYHTVMSVRKLEGEEATETGTTVTWQLDNEVFHDTAFTYQMFHELLETQSHVVAADIHFNSEEHNITKLYEGISTEYLFKSRIGEENILTTFEAKGIEQRGVENNKPYKAKCDIIIAAHKEDTGKDLYLHNTSLITEEIHPTYVQKGLDKFFNVVGKRSNLNIKQHDYVPYFSVLVETYMNANATSYKNQTKKGISNISIGTLIEETIFNLLEQAYSRREESIMSVVAQIMQTVRDRNAFEERKATASQVKKLTSKKKHKTDRVRSCKLGKKEGAEMIIVEGLSATPPVVSSRDSNLQAVFTSKGKIINALKHKLSKVLENDIVKDLIIELGVGVDLGENLQGNAVYNYKKLKYDKIIIMTDADKDGYQIRVLIFLVFYVLFPDLLRKGHVYVCETPLFRIVYKNGEREYAYDIEEREQMVAEASKRGWSVENVDRIKGLGGFNPGELRHTAMDKDKRRLIPLQMETDFHASRTLIDTMFGEDMLKKRKEIILEAIGLRNSTEIADEVGAVLEVDEVETA